MNATTADKAKTKKGAVTPLETEATETVDLSTTKGRIKAIKGALTATLTDSKDREALDALCASMGFNDFFHVRRLVNLEVSQGYVNTRKYFPAIEKLNAILASADVSEASIKLEKRDRSPRTKNPLSSKDAQKLLRGETIEVDGHNYKLVKA